jgi:shikimate kinase
MQRAQQNIFLVGPMGSGKTTIGKMVAEKLGLEFHDCDQDLEKSTGASVNLIFDVEGETGFRERETHLLQEISELKGMLVATGGGVVTRAENRKILRRSDLVIWLKTSIHQQIERLSHDKSRPLLQTADREETLNKLALERDPLYREVADIVFESPNRNSRFSANALSRQIEKFWKQGLTGEIRAHH